MERIEFTPGRSNLIVKYPGTGDATCAFVGSHMDVVRREGGREGGRDAETFSGMRRSRYGRTPSAEVLSFNQFISYLIHASLPPVNQTQVPANPETWERNPFELTREGDMLYGRGTTDCLGHVALITELLVQVRRKRGENMI